MNNTMLSTMIQTLEWVENVTEGEMVESPGWTKEHLSLYPITGISTKELDLICDTLNPLLKAINCPIRICWSAGEIRPVLDEKRIKILDS